VIGFLDGIIIFTTERCLPLYTVCRPLASANEFLLEIWLPLRAKMAGENGFRRQLCKFLKNNSSCYFKEKSLPHSSLWSTKQEVGGSHFIAEVASRTYSLLDRLVSSSTTVIVISINQASGSDVQL